MFSINRFAKINIDKVTQFLPLAMSLELLLFSTDLSYT